MLQGYGMTGTTRSSAGLDPRRRRLLYRCWHRGTREMDLIMGRFADATIDTLSEAEIDVFEALSEAPDPDLYAWISGERGVPAQYDHELMRRLRTFHHSGTT
jgi:antitoxin CptB